jgi:hypothetical protein
MSTRISFNSETAIGSLLAEGLDQLIEGKQKINRVTEILNAAIYAGDGQPPDMPAVEAELGLGSDQGQQAFDLINGAKMALDDGRIVALREIDQG